MRLPTEHTCKMCGGIYESSAPHSSYCSDACRREYETSYARKYRSEHREKITKYNREYWRKTHSEKKVQKSQSNHHGRASI